MLLMSVLTISAQAKHNITEVQTEEHIYYTDLFYAYPYYLVNDPFLSAYQSDVIGLSNTIYNNYNNSLVEWSTALEYGLETATSLSETLKFFSDEFGWSNYRYNDALDSANEYVVKQLLNSNRGEMAGTCEHIVKSTETILEYVQEEAKEDPSTSHCVKAAIDEMKKNSTQYFTQITTLDFDTFWEDIQDNLGSISEGIEAAKAISIALMMEDARIAHLNNIICVLETQTENTVLKQGMERLREQLCNDFISNFATNYLGKNFLLGKMIDKLGELGSTILGANHIFVLLGIVKLATFDIISNPPEYADIVTFEVLREYSKNIHTSIGDAASVFDDDAFTSNEIKKYESIFTVYTAINQATVELSKDIAEKSNPYSSIVYRHLQENLGDGTTEIILSSENNDDIKLDSTTITNENLLTQIKILKSCGVKNATLTVGIASLSFNILDTLLFEPLLESAKENLASINSFEANYSNRNIYNEYINSVKSYVAATPETQRIKTDTSNWTYVLKNNIGLKLQADEIEPNCIYTVNNTLLGSIKLKRGTLNMPEDLSITIDGDVYIYDKTSLNNYGNLTITGDLYADSASFLNNYNVLDTKNITLTWDSQYAWSGPSILNNGDIICEDFTVDSSTITSNFSDDSKLYVSGDFFFWDCHKHIIPNIIFNGTSTQFVNHLFADIIVIKNSSAQGVIFETAITSTILFNHKGNNFSLNKGGTFVDYDDDGLKDNIDPYPICTAHNWDNGTVTIQPTSKAEGVKIYTCSDCGETKTEAIEKLPPETTEAQTTAADTTVTFADTTANNEADSGCGSYLGGGVSVILLVSGLSAVTLRKKKRK